MVRRFIFKRYCIQSHYYTPKFAVTETESKDHFRLTLRHTGNVLELLKVGATIEDTLNSVNTQNTIG